MTLRSFSAITVSRGLNNEFKTVLAKDLTEQEAKDYIRIAIKNDGFGVMMSRTFPSGYPEFFKVTKPLINKYIRVMELKDFKQTLKMYDTLEKAGLKVSINF